MTTANATHLQGIDPLLKRPVVQDMTGFSRTTVHRKVKSGLLTRPIDIGHRLAWPASEIKALNKARIAGQTDEEIKKLVLELEAARGQS